MISLLKKNLVLVFICIVSITYGQNAIGGKIGLNFATFTGDTDDLESDGNDKGFNPGLQIGGVFEIGINDLISIQPELLYIQKGVRLKSSEDFFGNPVESEASLVFNYLELPLLVKIKLGNPESTNFFINVGPSFGYTLSGKSKSKISFDGETETNEEDFEFEENDEFNRFDISATLGAGVNIPLGPGKLFVEARYLLGFSNLIDSDFNDDKLKNGGIGLGVGYMVPLGGGKGE